MSKPSDLFRFAITGAGVDASNISPPPSGLEDTGYAFDAVPTSANFNFLMNSLSKWVTYLASGAFEGATSFADPVTFNAAVAFTVAAAFNGVATFNAGAAAAANQDIHVSGTGKFKHGTVTDVLSPFGAIAGNVNSPVVAMAPSNEMLQVNGSSAGAFCVIPLKLRVGWHVSEIRTRVLDNVTGPTKVSTQVAAITDGASALVYSGGGPSLGNATWQTVSLTGGGFVVAAGKAYHLRVALTGGASPCFVNHIEVDYDQP